MNFVYNTLIGAAILTALAFMPEVMLWILVVVAIITISYLIGFLIRLIWEELS